MFAWSFAVGIGGRYRLIVLRNADFRLKSPGTITLIRSIRIGIERSKMTVPDANDSRERPQTKYTKAKELIANHGN